MKILVTGARGQLGRDLIVELVSRGMDAVGTDLPETDGGDGLCPYFPMDITDAAAVRKKIAALKPDAVIHCAAWTAVDAAEEVENREKVFAVNGGGTRNIAAACRETGCRMMYISTDYVFDGTGCDPIPPDKSEYAPLNVYGRSKLEGEKAVSELLGAFFIVRTAWVFGANGQNFVRTMLRAGKKFDRVRVVNDQVGTPTYTPDLAALLADMIVTDRYGYYHATNEGGCISWYDFCREIYRQAGLKTEVVPVTTAQYGLSKAARPFNSRLDKSKLSENGFTPLPAWQDALRRYIRYLKDHDPEMRWLNE